MIPARRIAPAHCVLLLPRDWNENTRPLRSPGMRASAAISSFGMWARRSSSPLPVAPINTLRDVKSTSSHRTANACDMRAPVRYMKQHSAARLGLVACAMKASTHSHVARVLAFLTIGNRVTRMRGQSSCSAAWLIIACVGTMTPGSVWLVPHLDKASKPTAGSRRA